MTLEPVIVTITPSQSVTRYLIQKGDPGIVQSVNTISSANVILNSVAIDVTDLYYGADASGATDSTAEIQAAIDTGNSTVHFKEGTYLITSLTVASNQHLEGEGEDKTILTWDQVNNPSPTLNMLVSSGDLENFKLSKMTLRGNLLYQTTPDGTSQNMAALKFRTGSITNVLIEDVTIKEFGDQTKVSGAGGFFGPVSGTGQHIENLVFRRVTFKDIANVPGVYVNANGDYCSYAKKIIFENCTFENSVDYVRQNMIYVLTSALGATPTIYAENVSVENCVFEVNEDVDTCIELNDCSGFSVVKNHITVTGTASVTGILVRSSSKDGTILGNKILNFGSGCTTTAGIALIPFVTEIASASTIVSENLVVDFTRPCYLNSVSNVSVVNNTFIGSGRRVDYGALIAGAENWVFSDNRVLHATSGVTLATGIGGVVPLGKLTKNSFVDVGSSGGSILNTASSGVDLTGIEITENSVSALVAGTDYFCNLDCSATLNTQNKIINNLLPESLGVSNPSLDACIDVMLSLPAKKGEYAILGSSATWAQGQIDMDASTGVTAGYEIPGGSGVSVADAVIGDAVIVSNDQPTAGVVYVGYVSSTGYVKVRVQNGLSVSNSIPAATWKVSVVK